MKPIHFFIIFFIFVSGSSYRESQILKNCGKKIMLVLNKMEPDASKTIKEIKEIVKQEFDIN